MFYKILKIFKVEENIKLLLWNKFMSFVYSYEKHPASSTSDSYQISIKTFLTSHFLIKFQELVICILLWYMANIASYVEETRAECTQDHLDFSLRKHFFYFQLAGYFPFHRNRLGLRKWNKWKIHIFGWNFNVNYNELYENSNNFFVYFCFDISLLHWNKKILCTYYMYEHND